MNDHALDALLGYPIRTKNESLDNLPQSRKLVKLW